MESQYVVSTIPRFWTLRCWSAPENLIHVLLSFVSEKAKET